MIDFVVPKLPIQLGMHLWQLSPFLQYYKLSIHPFLHLSFPSCVFKVVAWQRNRHCV